MFAFQFGGNWVENAVFLTMCVHLFPVDTIIYRVFYSGVDVHGFCLSSLLFLLHKQFTTLFSMFVRTLLFLSCGGSFFADFILPQKWPLCKRYRNS